MKIVIIKLCRLFLRYFGQYLSDSLYLKLSFFASMGYRLNLKKPVTYNEKLQWLKLNDRNPLYTTLVDKLSVKKWVESKIGSEYIIPTLKIYHDVDEINLEELPNQFVLKTTHYGDSLGVVVCKDKSIFNLASAKERLAKSMTLDYYKAGREWPYKNVQRLIIAEEYKEDQFGELRDYKFFCFNGKVKAMFIASDRSTGNVFFDYYDENFNHLDFVQSHPMSGKAIEKPENYEEMIRIASALSGGLTHVRVDLYNVNGKIYFGEMTFYHYGGMVPFHPKEWDYKFGSWLVLPKISQN